MENEHFGISIVELMAAGIIVVAHASGGPLMDIIKDGKTGFLASTVDDYSRCLLKIMNLSDEESMKLRLEARNDVLKFSDEKFTEQLLPHLKNFLKR